MSKIRLIGIAVLLGGFCFGAEPSGGSAAEDVVRLQEKFLRERRPADKKAWYAACERAGVDVTKWRPASVSKSVPARPRPVTRYGFTVLKEKTGTHPMPKIALPDGWRIVEGEAHTGVNVREAYVLVETDGTNAAAPKVTFDWPEAGVRRVLGPEKGHAPRGMWTDFPSDDALSFSITHHIRGMEAGPYREKPYPEKEIAAADNFLFALRDGFRLLGLNRKGAIKGGSIILMGFDTHYPNGHTDYSAHFHIINDCRDGKQVSHFYMDPTNGRLTEDCFQDMNRPADSWERLYWHRPGDSWEMYDGFADVAYVVTMLKDGVGLEIATTNGAFRVTGERPCESVRLSVREGDRWREVKTVEVHDDPLCGEMMTPDGVIRYNPDTFEMLMR